LFYLFQAQNKWFRPDFHNDLKKNKKLFYVQIKNYNKRIGKSEESIHTK